MSHINDILVVPELPRLLAQFLVLADIASCRMVSRSWVNRFCPYVGLHVSLMEIGLQDAQIILENNDYFVGSLHLNLREQPLDEAIMDLALTRCRRLGCLTLDLRGDTLAPQAVAIVQANPQLQELNLSFSILSSPDVLLPILSAAPRLRVLKIATCTHLDSIVMAAIAETCLWLRHLTLQGVVLDLVPPLRAYHFPCLERLKVDSPNHAQVWELARRVPRLQWIDLGAELLYFRGHGSILFRPLYVPNLWALTLQCGCSSDKRIVRAIKTSAGIWWQSVTLHDVWTPKAIVPALCEHWGSNLCSLRLLRVRSYLGLLDMLLTGLPQLMKLEITVQKSRPVPTDICVWILHPSRPWVCDRLQILDLPLHLPPLILHAQEFTLDHQQAWEDVRLQFFQHLQQLSELHTVTFCYGDNENDIPQRMARVNGLIPGRACFKQLNE
ncbi:hypothetical protein BGZ73_008331 [Actinomortierella ambigua]|nr:hypothetical protein BGZ73_008331 [Actinomortierella ambigua]